VKIKIGTRDSKLAMWQAKMVASQLEASGLVVELFPIKTKGDKILDRSLSKIGSKGVFTEELEEGLRDGTFDIAVHSAKDVQSTLPDDLPLIAYGEREAPGDVVVSFDPDFKLNPNSKVASSSTRRIAFLKANYPGIEVVGIRGNLQTRFRKLEEGVADAMLLAHAGVIRMGLEEHIVQILPVDEFVPPAGQGVVAIQAKPERICEQGVHAIRVACNNEEVESVIVAERSFLAEFDGGCSIPSFCHIVKGNDGYTIDAGILSLDGETCVSVKKIIAGDLSLEASEVAKEILAKGGAEILKQIRDEQE
jgi:hydroxymethylbilane synthase